MPKKYDFLTKTKIQSGQQCTKKLWFDVHQPIKDRIKKSIFERGNRFNDVVRKHYTKVYGKSKNLDGDWYGPIKKTEEAINSSDINVIYEGTFEYLNTQVKTDVLIRKKNGWELLEAKSSTKLKPEHIPDISIQSFIVRKCMEQLGHNLISIKLIHINRDFTLKKEGDYQDFINDENDLTGKIIETEITNYIENLIPLTIKNSPCPEKDMGPHCRKPYDCDYQDRCKSLLPKSNVTSFTILPYIGKDKKLNEYMKKEGTMDLQKVPLRFFKDRKDYAPGYHKIIQDAHKNNEPWFSPNLKNIFKKFSFPFYFIDFETIMQGVPIIKGTQPYYAVPFQWSLHKWDSVDKEINDGESFLKFKDHDIERQFIESLLKAVDENGTIFAHNANGTEIKTLGRLKDKGNCKELEDKIDKLIERIEDSLIIARNNFYSPLMNGDWGIKSIIKAIPDSNISYEEAGNIDGGDAAQLAWFICTNPKTSDDDKKKEKKLLIDYCAKDTLAVYYLIKYLINKSEEAGN